MNGFSNKQNRGWLTGLTVARSPSVNHGGKATGPPDGYDTPSRGALGIFQCLPYCESATWLGNPWTKNGGFTGKIFDSRWWIFSCHGWVLDAYWDIYVGDIYDFLTSMWILRIFSLFSREMIYTSWAFQIDLRYRWLISRISQWIDPENRGSKIEKSSAAIGFLGSLLFLVNKWWIELWICVCLYLIILSVLSKLI